MQRQTLIDSLIPVQKKGSQPLDILPECSRCKKKKNVLPPTLLTLHIPHAPVLLSFFFFFFGDLAQLPGSSDISSEISLTHIEWMAASELIWNLDLGD